MRRSTTIQECICQFVIAQTVTQLSPLIRKLSRRTDQRGTHGSSDWLIHSDKWWTQTSRHAPLTDNIQTRPLSASTSPDVGPTVWHDVLSTVNAEVSSPRVANAYTPFTYPSLRLSVRLVALACASMVTHPSTGRARRTTTSLPLRHIAISHSRQHTTQVQLATPRPYMTTAQ